MLRLSDIQRMTGDEKKSQQTQRRGWQKPLFVWLILLVVTLGLQTFMIMEPDVAVLNDDDVYISVSGVAHSAHDPTGAVWIVDEYDYIHHITEQGTEEIDSGDLIYELVEYIRDPPIRAIIALDNEAIVALDNFLLAYDGNKWEAVAYGVRPPGTVIELALDEDNRRLYALDDSGHFTGIKGSFPLHELLNLPQPVRTYDMTFTPSSGIWLTADDTLWHFYKQRWTQVHQFATDNARFIGQTDTHVWVKTEANRTLTAVPLTRSEPVITQSFDEINLPDDVEIGELHPIDNQIYLATSAGVFRQQADLSRTWTPLPLDTAWNRSAYAYFGAPGDLVMINEQDIRTYGDSFVMSLHGLTLMILSFLILFTGIPGGAVFVMRRITGKKNPHKDRLQDQLKALFPASELERRYGKRKSKRSDIERPAYTGSLKTGCARLFAFLFIANVLAWLLQTFGVNPINFIESISPESMFLIIIPVLVNYMIAYYLSGLFFNDDTPGSTDRLTKTGLNSLRAIFFGLLAVIPGLMLAYLPLDISIITSLQMTWSVLAYYLAKIAQQMLFEPEPDTQNAPPWPFTTSVDVQPDDDDWLNQIAYQANKGHLNEAAYHLHRIISQHLKRMSFDEMLHALLLAGYIHEQRGDRQGAYQRYKTALFNSSDNPLPRLVMTEMHLFQGERQVALACARQARDLYAINATTPDARQQATQYDALYAAALAAGNQKRQANRLIKQVLQIRTQFPTRTQGYFLYYAAYVLLQQNQRQQAMQFLKQAVAHNPSLKRRLMTRWMVQQLR